MRSNSSVHPWSTWMFWKMCTKASTPTKPDQPAKGGSHKVCVVKVSSVVIRKTGTCRGCWTSPKFQITSGDANHFSLPTHRASDLYMPKASTLKKLLTFHFYSLAYEAHFYRQVKKIKRKLCFGETEIICYRMSIGNLQSVLKKRTSRFFNNINKW